MATTPGPSLQRILDSNIHLEGRCRAYLRYTFAAARAVDRLERRTERNDTIRDIRLQRQARGLAYGLIELGTPHSDHSHLDCQARI